MPSLAGFLVQRAPENVLMGFWKTRFASRHSGQSDGHFRDLFSCTFLTKDFPENRAKVPGVPGFYSGRSRTCGDHIPAHLPAMNPDKALASGWEEGGWLRAGGGAPGPEVTCTPFNPLLRRRAPTGRRSGLPKPCLIREKPCLLFSDNRIIRPVWLDSWTKGLRKMC